MSKDWLYDASNSNIFKQSYMKDFLDVSGDVYIRNGNLIATNDISLNGDISCNDISLSVPFTTTGINTDISNALALKQDTLSAGTGITIDGTTINGPSVGTGISSITNHSTYIGVDGNLNITGNLTINGDLSADGVVLHTSDDRLKDNEKRIENALETLDKLKPKKYKINGNVETGFIAQDIWYGAPELRHNIKTYKENIVDISGDFTYDMDVTDLGWSVKPAQLNYIGLIGHITKGIQELDGKIKNNKVKIGELK